MSRSWAAVVPTGSDTRKPPKYELVIYLSFKVMASSFISLFVFLPRLKGCRMRYELFGYDLS